MAARRSTQPISTDSRRAIAGDARRYHQQGQHPCLAGAVGTQPHPLLLIDGEARGRQHHEQQHQAGPALAGSCDTWTRAPALDGTRTVVVVVEVVVVMRRVR